MPTSKLTRVLSDGFSKSSAMIFPAKGRVASPRLISSAIATSGATSCAATSATDRKSLPIFHITLPAR